MTASGNHIVNKIRYQVRGLPAQKAFEIKDQVASYIKGSFSKKLQTLFDSYFPGEELVHIDKLELEINLQNGELDLPAYEKQLLALLEKQLQKASVKKATHPNSSEKQNQIIIAPDNKKELIGNYSPADAFIFFLEKGHLPWWCKMVAMQELEIKLIAWLSITGKAAKLALISRVANGQPATVKRFIHRFSNEFKLKFIDVFFGEETKAIEKIQLKLIEAATDSLRPSLKKTKTDAHRQKLKFRQTAEKVNSLFWSILLETVKTNGTLRQFRTEIKNLEQKFSALAESTPTAITHLEQIIKESKDGEELLHISKKLDANEVSDEETEAIFINNAGIVILHPFLSPIFDALSITKDDAIVDFPKAIAALNYLCGYEALQPEFEWPLFKVICGMELSQTIEYTAELSDADRLECDALLQQVIDYWIALKQTSAEGLQQTFIQRFGKLSRTDTGWFLQVEQKTVDVLKDRMPWGVSMIKLPWMKQLLTVEW